MNTPRPAGARLAVLKFGGDVVADPPRLMQVLGAVAERVADGWRFVLCHGGGPQISSLTRRLGLTPTKVGGRRVTDGPTLQIVKQVLGGEVNVDVVAAAIGAGLNAVGVSGVSAATVDAARRPPVTVSGGGPAPIDFGHVGRIRAIHTGLLTHLLEGGFVPVLSPLAIDPPLADGGPAPVYNINADTVASQLAAALDADHLFLMTGVPGVLRDRDDPTTRIPRLDAAAARAAIADGVIAGGMIPKVEEALARLRGADGHGVAAIHILGADARALHAEADAPGSYGTVLTP